MTTAHVSVALLDGEPPSEAELRDAVEWVTARHPLLRSCVRGLGKFHVPDAKEYTLHSDYVGQAVAYNKELAHVEPETDVQVFVPSSLSVEEVRPIAAFLATALPPLSPRRHRRRGRCRRGRLICATDEPGATTRVRAAGVKSAPRRDGVRCGRLRRRLACRLQRRP